MKEKAELINGINFIALRLDGDAKAAKDLAFALNKDLENLFLIVGTAGGGKANLTIMISQELVDGRKLNAGNIIRELAKEIQGGGGGQPHFASAGGKDAGGFDRAFNKAREIVATS